MANTYSRLYVHIIFAVKGRANLISEKWREDLYKYISGIITNKNQKLMIINGMPDHILILLGFNPDSVISDIVRDIKSNSSRWINDNRFVQGKFEWQNGFGAFSVGYSNIRMVADYIQNQQQHHRNKSFRDEFIKMLDKYHISYKPEYLFYDYGTYEKHETTCRS